MGIKFKDMCSSGGFNGAYIFHVAGFPFAFTNSQKLIDALKSPAHSPLNAAGKLRKDMFGDASNSGHFFCDDIIILPLLDPDLGRQVISYNENKTLDVGSWSVKINRQETGATFPINTGLECWGLPGIDCLFDSDSSSVKTGVLSKDHTPTFYNLTWTLDSGLKAWLNAKYAAGEQALIWCGSACFAMNSSVSTSGFNHTVGVIKKVWGTPKEYIYKDNENSQEVIELRNAPPAIVGMTARLFVIPTDNNGDILDSSPTMGKPVLLRTGQVNNSPTGNAKNWRISCSGLTKPLKKKIPDSRWEGLLSGFHFNRCEATARNFQVPHIVVTEYKYIPGSSPPSFSVWTNYAYVGAITAGNYKGFKTLDELKQDLLVQVTAMSTQLKYKIVDGDLVWEHPAGADKWSVAVHGCAAYASGFGYTKVSDKEIIEKDNSTPIPQWAYENKKEGLNYSDHKSYSLFLREKNDVNAEDVLAAFDYDEPKSAVSKSKFECKYFYEWDFAKGKTNDTDYRAGGWVSLWPVPQLFAFGARGFTVSGQTDATLLTGGYLISLGSRENRYKESDACALSETSGGKEFSFLLSGEVQPTPSTSDFFAVASDKLGPVSGVSRVMIGQCLFWMPSFFEEDPWAIADIKSISSAKPVEIFKELLGGGSGATYVPHRLQTTSIPDLFITGYKYELVDWDALEALIAGAGYTDATYSIDVDTETSILSALNGLCLTHGVRMIFLYVESRRAFCISFERMENEAVSKTVNAGRSINSTDLILKEPSEILGDEKLYAGIKLHMQNIAGRKVTFDVFNKIGKAPQNNSLEIKDVVTAAPPVGTSDFDYLTLLLTNYLRSFSSPAFDQKLSTRINKLTSFSVGGSLNLTSEILTDPTIGRRGLDSAQARVMRASINFGRDARIDYNVQINTKKYRGLAPSFNMENSYIDAFGSTLALSGLLTNPSSNEFQNPLSGLCDWMYFGCTQYSPGSDRVTPRACGCSDYAVTIIERGSNSLTDAGSARNVWHGVYIQPTTTDLSMGTGIIVLNDATNFAARKAAGVDFILEFGASNLCQPCQTSLYAFWGDSSGEWTDAASKTNRSLIG